MKKIYQTPSVKETLIKTVQMMATSLGKNATGANSGVVLTREDNSWDIWGNNETEFED